MELLKVPGYDGAEQSNSLPNHESDPQNDSRDSIKYFQIESIPIPVPGNEKPKKRNRLFKNLLKRSGSLPETSMEGDSIKHHRTFHLFGRKNPNDQKKIQKKLSDDGHKHMTDLVEYLYKQKPLVERRYDFETDDLDLIRSKHKPIDLDKFFKRDRLSEVTRKREDYWKMLELYEIKNQNNKKNKSLENEDLTEKGFRVINRFGRGVSDGCDITLSLPKDQKDVAKFVRKDIQWKDIVAEADDALNAIESSGRKRMISARRGSILPPKFVFLSPHPETGWSKVLYTAHCIPLREWSSELFLPSKESSLLLDPEMKRNIKWNASLEDFRHLLSPELSHFGNDINSVLVQAKRRLSVCPQRPVHIATPVQFRRQSYGGGNIWTPKQLNDKKKREYKKRLQMIQHSVMAKGRRKSKVSIQSEDSALLSLGSTLSLNTHSDEDTVSLSLVGNSANDFYPIHTLNPKIMANELTLIAQELILSLQRAEIIALLIRPHSANPDTCPNVTALLGFQKRVLQLIATFILNETNLEERAKKIAFLINVANELKELKNWHSLNSIISSLQCPPVARLKQTWKMVSSKHLDEYIMFNHISEEINDNNSHDHTPPTILIFNHLIDNFKNRCGYKMLEIKQHRLRQHWTKPKNINDWVEDEIHDLVNAASEEKKFKKKIERLTSSPNIGSPNIPRKGFFGKFKGFSKKKSHSIDTTSIRTGSSPGRESILSLSEFEFENRKSLTNDTTGRGLQYAGKANWSVIDMQKLKEEEGREILREIARELVDYQRNVMMYNLKDHNEITRDFLLMQNYNSMDNNMKQSLTLEPSQEKNFMVKFTKHD